jgi:hypothetical protein
MVHAVAGGPGQLNTVAGGPGQSNTVAGGPGQSNTVAGGPGQSNTVADAPQAGPPLPAAVREALGELTAAFAGLAEPGDPARAAEHAACARSLATAADQSSSQAQLMARLIETAADDTLRFANP